MLQNVLKEAREALHLKQAEVAEYVGVTTQTYLKWENGKNEPKASHLKKLTKILKVTGSELIDGHRINDTVDQLSFMQKVSPARTFIDDVTFMSLIYAGIEDKEKFLSDLDRTIKKLHGFGIDHLEDMPLSVEEEALERLDHIAAVKAHEEMEGE